jgi:hypothetical protein
MQSTIDRYVTLLLVASSPRPLSQMNSPASTTAVAAEAAQEVAVLIAASTASDACDIQCALEQLKWYCQTFIAPAVQLEIQWAHFNLQAAAVQGQASVMEKVEEMWRAQCDMGAVMREAERWLEVATRGEDRESTAVRSSLKHSFGTHASQMQSTGGATMLEHVRPAA